jgi:hypothetical protein
MGNVAGRDNADGRAWIQQRGDLNDSRLRLSGERVEPCMWTVAEEPPDNACWPAVAVQQPQAT